MKGLLVIISAPSGAGKSTIIRKVLAQDPKCKFAISHTTRPPRNGEIDGTDYYFISREQFHSMGNAGQFAEWAEVHSNLYGTSKAEVERLSKQGLDVVFEVDYQGGRSLMRLYPEALSIFVLPPSMAEVRKRLTLRGTDDEATIRLRLNNARVEIATAGEYQFVVTNGDLDCAVADVMKIIEVQRMRSTAYAATIRELVAESADSL